MENVTCPKCGRIYPKDAMVCPGCKHPNDSFEEALPQNSHPPINRKKELSTKFLFWGIFALIIGIVGTLLSEGIWQIFFMYFISGGGVAFLITSFVINLSRE